MIWLENVNLSGWFPRRALVTVSLSSIVLLRPVCSEEELREEERNDRLGRNNNKSLIC